MHIYDNIQKLLIFDKSASSQQSDLVKRDSKFYQSQIISIENLVSTLIECIDEIDKNIQNQQT